ncbi:MAG: acyl-CoA dehydratase activase, partial [Planctomycetota bacterium]
MDHVGVNIGALTVKVVALGGGTPYCRVVAHQGRPLDALEALLAAPELADAESFGVSGYLGHIPEVAAIQRALRELDGDFDAVASLGGESFLVYLLADGRITNVLSHNKCAAGSGEFFVQQIGRMGLDIDEAIERSVAGKVVPLAARCSVHCKSDITHKLNRREASPEDILHTLHDSMANKVASLLERSQRELRRVLLIGGVTRNAAMLSALQEKLASAEIVVLPESPWFEAWGSALLARDEPRYPSPKISVPPSLGSLPALGLYADRVQVLGAGPCQAPGNGPLVLGVDAGSTTTKVVLLDPADQGVVASHYARTSGDPVAATRECLRAVAGRVGNGRVTLVAATGSARELVGAYLGTAHVYNEISAHAAGATHFDPDVDTIFEIGGQDSKYIRLRNGVPVEYAMNDACSAGTGSFLEESAQGDLGISVTDIAEIALTADAPVHLKANCAAFINSDIRIAQQQGRSRANIVAGLVYAIATNYLAKVKGSRSVGDKVFLQGGVALNRAVGHAIAHGVGRQVVIPPSPELLGALGVALLALRRSGGAPGTEAGLLSLAAPEMRSVGRFTCRACAMYCGIDHFEVAGRRFPFGGRCSLFERAGRGKNQVTAAPDLVEQRHELLFGDRRDRRERRDRSDRAAPDAPRIGIPRALTTHSLYPLYRTFFSRLGLEAVLSGVHPQGDLKSYSGFCFPAQIAHGAVLDLAHRGIDQVFLPQVLRMPLRHHGRDSYLCPITQASPYFLARAFPDIRFFSPLLDFSNGYQDSEAIAELAVGQLGYPRPLVREAWADAVRAQTEAEQALRELGQRALEQAVACGEPAILLIGHSYNAFAPEASLSVGKKLASMGLVAIPGDCLVPIEPGPTSWHFSNQILNAVALARRHHNLFLLGVSNFSCTIDAFTHGMLASEMGSKPYLILEIDAHTADAGVQTRLEAFLDIIGNYRQTPARHRPDREFSPCRLAAGGRVVRSNGEQVPLSDPRVKLYFPNFSRYHVQALTMAARCLGLQAGEVVPLDRSQLDEGLRYASGRECLPLPVCIGQMLTVQENRPPGEIAGFYMLSGGAPCVADAYQDYLERFIAERRLDDLFLLVPSEENGYCGFGPRTLAEHVSPAILLADLIVEIDQVLCVVGAEGSTNRLRQHWEELVASVRSLDQLHAELPAFVDRLAALPRTRDPRACPRVVVTGDFFTRFSPFFMAGVHDLYARRGIILKPVDLSDLFQYATYHEVAGAACAWGMKPGGLALAKACTRVFQQDGREYLQQWLVYQAQRRAEERYRRLFRKSGLLLSGPNEVASLFERASELVSPTIFGEVIPTVGRGLQAEQEGYDGVILIGPFNCLPFRISEAILQPVSIRRGMPILAYESDGYAVPPSFLRQVEVHIQQVLEHA